jgi:hypothetical protein
VENAAVLDVGVVADANFVDVAAQDGIHPDADVLAENNVADELGRVVNVARLLDLGSLSHVGADHGDSQDSRKERRIADLESQGKSKSQMEDGDHEGPEVSRRKNTGISKWRR